ncbi:MAG: hypothetical protein H6719_33820 [Sandaracinaceae bacterium]|nr:hypothetical protein [Sandaracinaceae bacterium]
MGARSSASSPATPKPSSFTWSPAVNAPPARNTLSRSSSPWTIAAPCAGSSPRATCSEQPRTRAGERAARPRVVLERLSLERLQHQERRAARRIHARVEHRGDVLGGHARHHGGHLREARLLRVVLHERRVEHLHRARTAGGLDEVEGAVPERAHDAVLAGEQGAGAKPLSIAITSAV